MKQNFFSRLRNIDPNIFVTGRIFGFYRVPLDNETSKKFFNTKANVKTLKNSRLNKK